MDSATIALLYEIAKPDKVGFYSNLSFVDQSPAGLFSGRL
jgi:hypothetical protein